MLLKNQTLFFLAEVSEYTFYVRKIELLNFKMSWNLRGQWVQFYFLLIGKQI